MSRSQPAYGEAPEHSQLEAGGGMAHHSHKDAQIAGASRGLWQTKPSQELAVQEGSAMLPLALRHNHRACNSQTHHKQASYCNYH